MTDNIKVACAAQAGNLHFAAKLPCQDSVAFYRSEQACCLALADGAGSVSGSELASSAVCNSLAKAAADSFEEWFAMEDEALKRVILRLAADSTEEADPGRRPDCTLLLTAISKDGRVMWCHIGDGGIFCVFDGESILLSAPENGVEAYITFFLSGKEAAKHLRIGRSFLFRDGVFLLCSDGVEPTLYDVENEKCAAAVRILAGWILTESDRTVSEALGEHLSGIFREKTDDDLSLGLIAYVCPANDAPSEENRSSA